MTIDWDNILKQIRFALARPVHPRGVIWVGVPLILSVLSLAFSWHGGNFWLAVTILFYICFRDPARVPPIADKVAAAPVDGILTKIESAPWPIEVPMEATGSGRAQCLVINPRFYDVHGLRAPISGGVTLAQQISGQWGSPVFDKSAAGNERAVMIFKLADGRAAALEIIGGAVPDRIRLSARAGDVVTLAQPIAYASFGGEVRLYVPDGVNVTARPGQRMVAGETVIVTL